MKRCRKLEKIMGELESSFPNAEIVREKSIVNIHLGKTTSILVKIMEWNLFWVDILRYTPIGVLGRHCKTTNIQAIKDFFDKYKYEYLEKGEDV